MLIIEEGWTKTTLNQAQKEDILSNVKKTCVFTN